MVSGTSSPGRSSCASKDTDSGFTYKLGAFRRSSAKGGDAFGSPTHLEPTAGQLTRHRPAPGRMPHDACGPFGAPDDLTPTIEQSRMRLLPSYSTADRA